MRNYFLILVYVSFKSTMACIFGIAALTNCCCFLWAALHLLIKERFWNYAKYSGIQIWSFHECAVAWDQYQFIFLSLLIQQLGISLTLQQTSTNSGSIGSSKWSSTKDKRPWYFLVTGSDSSSVCSCYPLMNIGFGCRIFILKMWACCYGHRIILIAWSFGSARYNKALFSLEDIVEVPSLDGFFGIDPICCEVPSALIDPF